MLLLDAKPTVKAALDSVNSPLTPIVIGVVSALVFLLLAILVAKLIKYEPGANPKDRQKRRLWFWVFAVLATIVSFVLIYFVFPPICSVEVFSNLKNVDDDLIRKFSINLHKYNLWSGISTAGTFVLYVVLGLILSKVFKSKKIGDWF